MRRTLIAVWLVAFCAFFVFSQDYISVTGNSYISYKPVSIHIVGYLAGYGDSAVEANKKYTNQKNIIVRALEQAGIPKGQMSQNNYRLQTNADQENVPGKMKAEGFLEINHSLLDSNDNILDILCKNGIARIDVVEVKKIIDQDSYAKAYADAYLDAYKKAQQLVSPTKRNIGKLTNVSENSGYSESQFDVFSSSDIPFIQGNSVLVSIAFSFSIND